MNRFRLLLAFTVASSTVAFGQPLPADEMRAHFIDVGQGDATLLEFSCGAVLIDTGGELNDEFNSNEALLEYLNEFFHRRKDLKNRLDGLVLSHPHVDHTRGVDVVIKNFKPKNVVTNGQQTGSGKAGQLAAQTYASLSEETPDTADDVGFLAAETTQLTADGFTSPVIDPVRCDGADPVLKVLWGRVAANPGWTKDGFKNANNHSVVTRVDFGKASFLFTGDIETEGIAALIAKYKDSKLLDVDVYKVGHHGAGNATTQALLGAVTPKAAVMMAGPKEREDSWTAWAYGHPRKTIVELMVPKVTTKRKSAMQAAVATGVRTFVNMSISKAIYSTSWDGTVVLRAKSDGAIDVLGAEPARLDLNVASVDDLVLLPALGRSRAEAIVKYRVDHGGRFSSVEELTHVAGIGPATFTAVRDLVAVGP